MQLTPINPHFNACNQQWDEMNPVEGGRHCASCDRVLTDFAGLPTYEVLKLQRENNFKLCGKYTSSQVDAIDRYLSRKEADEQPKRIPWLVAAAMGALTTLPTMDMMAQSVNNPPLIIREYIPVDTIPVEIKTTESEQQTITIRGTVVEAETGEPIPFASVVLDKWSIGTITDLDGRFELKIPIDSIKGEVWLNFSSIGYETKSIFLFSKENVQDLDIELEVAIERGVLGMMVGALVFVPSPAQKAKMFFKKWNPAFWVRKVQNRKLYGKY